ncbi:hypothetical protein MKW92_013981 [Papaver armeniacum]|nr:hypothetical protein MKW92_013981 [Papaver armeniacum]
MKRSYCHHLLQTCRNLEQLKQIHAQTLTQGLHHLQNLSCKIFNTYTKFNKPIEAYNVFNQIQNPDIVSWTCLLSLHLNIDRPFEALLVFSKLSSLGLKPDSFSVVGALTACGRSENLGHGKAVHGMIYRHELVASGSIVGNALIDMYSRNGKIEVAQMVFDEMKSKDVATWTSLMHGFIKCDDLSSARSLFDKMPERNSVSWTAMITGYIQGGKPIEALQIFQKMKSDGSDHPTAVMTVAVLSGCADIGALDLGQLIHGYVTKTYLNLDVTVKNALMDMYCKSGSLESAERIFEEISTKDNFSWTTMILGFAVHGSGKRALEIFSEMLESGRAGLVDEAKDLIQKMKIQPDGIIWRSLLSSSIACKNVEIALLAGKKIVELEPSDDGVYVLLWNMYCSANQWEEAIKMRKLMKDRRIKKKPGRSCIEINGGVTQFLAEDKTPNPGTETQLVLERMAQVMKVDNSYLFGMEFD